MNYQPSLFETGAAVPLREDLIGVLPGEYAGVLIRAGLDYERQAIAVQRLVRAPRSSLAWFSGVCRELALDQAAPGPKQGMFL